MCNALSLLAQNATLSLVLKDGAQFNGAVLGAVPTSEESWGRRLELGPLQHGQSRDVVVPILVPAASATYLQAVLQFTELGGDAPSRVHGVGTRRGDSALTTTAILRGKTVDVGLGAVKRASAKGSVGVDEALQCITTLSAAFGTSSEGAETEALRTDVNGRMTKALTGKDRFDRWGRHYLRALLRAHQIQQCTNFMDAGLQPYGGERFRTLRAAGDETFLKLPMPKPAPKPVAPAASYSRLTTEAASRGRPTTAPVRRRSPSPPRSPSPDANTYYGGCGGG